MINGFIGPFDRNLGIIVALSLVRGSLKDRALIWCTFFKSLKTISNAYHTFNGSRERRAPPFIVQNASSSSSTRVCWTVLAPFNKMDCQIFAPRFMDLFRCFFAEDYFEKTRYSNRSSSSVGWAVATSIMSPLHLVLVCWFLSWKMIPPDALRWAIQESGKEGEEAIAILFIWKYHQ